MIERYSIFCTSVCLQYDIQKENNRGWKLRLTSPITGGSAKIFLHFYSYSIKS